MFSYTSSAIKDSVATADQSRFAAKLIRLDQSLVLVVNLNILISSYNILPKRDTLADNQLCHHNVNGTAISAFKISPLLVLCKNINLMLTDSEPAIRLFN